MRTIFKNLAAAVVLVTAVSLAPAGVSAFTGEEGLPMAGPRFNRMSTELGLSAQQQQDIKAILRKDGAQFLPLLKQFMAERRALRALIQADALDEAAIRAQSVKVAAIQADLAVQRARVGQEVRKLLTPEQTLKLKEFQAGMDGKRDRMLSRAIRRIERDK